MYTPARSSVYAYECPSVESTCIPVFLYTFVKKYNHLRALERMSAVKDFITSCGNSRLGLKAEPRWEMHLRAHPDI